MEKKLIYAQIAINVMNEDFIVKRREFSTPETRKITTERPRKAAGMPANLRENNAVPDETTSESLPKMFDHASNFACQETGKTNKLEAIRTVNAKVAVKWTETDNLGAWKPGWYMGKVQRYNPQNDEIAV